MEKNTIIGIILIILSIHQIFNRKWIAEKQEAWAKKRGGIILRSYQSKSRKEQEAMIAISGPLSLLAGLGFIFSDKLPNLKVVNGNISLYETFSSFVLLIVGILLISFTNHFIDLNQKIAQSLYEKKKLRILLFFKEQFQTREFKFVAFIVGLFFIISSLNTLLK